MFTRGTRGCLDEARCSRRCGAVTVEAAIVVPFLAVLTLATIDVGQYVLVAQAVSNASREAARLAARYTTVSVTEVERAASDYLAESFPAVAVEVNVSDGLGNPIPSGDLTTIPSGSSIIVEVLFPFDALRWVNVVPLLNNSSLTTTTTVRRE